MTRFTGSFTQQEPIPEEAIAAAVAVMRSGRLHRYNVAEGQVSETALLEEEFAESIGARYCLALASGGAAMTTAMRALGVGSGERVLTNAFTLAPVPGAIAAVGVVPEYVEVTEDLVIDLDDLAAKAGRARVLLLSHMRGHICDMDALMEIAEASDLTVIEDCAHTMGGAWDGTPSGRFGKAGCFSTQTYKHLNSGEGGFLVTDDPDLMARAVILSGSYMNYGLHSAVPERKYFEAVRLETPNVSSRMDNLRAAILRPQLRDLATQAARWNALYAAVAERLEGVRLPVRPAKEQFVASSIQFSLPDWPGPAIAGLVNRCAERGVQLKWFGAAEPVGFTSRYDTWRYAPVPDLPRTDRVLAGLLDMRLPLTFSLADCRLIAEIISEEVARGPIPAEGPALAVQ